MQAHQHCLARGSNAEGRCYITISGIWHIGRSTSSEAISLLRCQPGHSTESEMTTFQSNGRLLLHQVVISASPPARCRAGGRRGCGQRGPPSALLPALEQLVGSTYALQRNWHIKADTQHPLLPALGQLVGSTYALPRTWHIKADTQHPQA